MTKEEIGRVLKAAREHKGLTQSQAAEMIGRRQQVIGNWETGYAQPDANMLFVLCDMYGISIDDAFGAGRKIQVSTSEMDHIEKYRALDNYGKELIDTILKIEHERCNRPRDDHGAEKAYQMLLEKKRKEAALREEGGDEALHA